MARSEEEFKTFLSIANSLLGVWSPKLTMTQKQDSSAPSSMPPSGTATTMPSPPVQQLWQLLLLNSFLGWSTWIFAGLVPVSSCTRRPGTRWPARRQWDLLSVEISIMLMTFTLMWRTVVANIGPESPIYCKRWFLLCLEIICTIFSYYIYISSYFVLS